MKPTGLPLLPLVVNESDRREWELWLRAVVERVRREGVASSVSSDHQRGRVEGAERVTEWLLSSLPPAPVAE